MTYLPVDDRDGGRLARRKLAPLSLTCHIIHPLLVLGQEAPFHVSVLVYVAFTFVYIQV